MHSHTGLNARAGQRARASQLALRLTLNFLYAGILTMALPWLIYRRFTTDRYRDGIRSKLLGVRRSDLPQLNGRSNSISTPSASENACGKSLSPTVWLHGVSVGEIQLLASVWKSWSQENQDLHFVVSTTTDSGMALARKLFPNVDIVYFPLDFSWAVRTTLETIRPNLIVLGELELWPNLTSLSQQQGIPVAVINGRLSDGSFRNYRRLGRLTEAMFSRLAYVGAQTETYAHRFEWCGTIPENIDVTGSIKFDNVEFDREHPEVEQRRSLVGLTEAHTTLVIGSTQSPEELTALKAYLDLRDRFPELRLVVVPRHPDRFDSVFAELNDADVKLLRRSELDSPASAADWEVLLVDTIGELRWWWGTADLAIVGGSFVSRGGQNMIEPAAFGANVAFGPNTSNFRDVVKLLLDNSAAEVIPTLEGMRLWIDAQLRNPQPGAERARNAIRIIQSQQGATRTTIESLTSLLDLDPTADNQNHSAPAGGRPEPTPGPSGAQSEQAA